VAGHAVLAPDTILIGGLVDRSAVDAQGSLEDLAVATAAIRRTYAPHAGIGAKIMLVKRPIAVMDYEHDASITRRFVDIVARGEGIHSMLSPLEFHRQIIGVLYTGLRSSQSIGHRLYSRVTLFARPLEPVLGASPKANRAVQLRVEEERQQIATQLYSTTGQLLFGIGISARNCAEPEDRDPATLRADFRMKSVSDVS
jgi:signal transduction histidine kinase